MAPNNTAVVPQLDVPLRSSTMPGPHATPQTGLRNARLAPMRVTSLPGGSDHSLADTMKQIQATREALRAELPNLKNKSAGIAAPADAQCNTGPHGVSSSIQGPTALRRCVSDGMCFFIEVVIH